MAARWIPVVGTIDVEDGEIHYRGKPATTDAAGHLIHSVGLALSDQDFGGGTITTGLRFDAVSTNTFAGLVLYYEPQPSP